MKRRTLAIIISAGICLSMASVPIYPTETASALAPLEYDVLASASISEPTILIGEYAQIELEWAGNCERKPYVSYHSNDPKILQTSDDGKVFGVGNGTTTVLVSANNAFIEVEVTVKPPSGGTLGDNITWSFDEETGTLTVEGEGDISIEDDAPWKEWRKDTKILVIGEGITSIPSNAFTLFTVIDTVELPSTVKEIDFSSVLQLLCGELIVSPDNPYFTSEDGVLFNKDKTELLKYPALSDKTSYEIPDSVTKIIDFAFFNCRNLQSVVIPDSVTDIGSNFYNARALTDVSMSRNLTHLDGMSFRSSPWLEAMQETDPLVITGGFVLNGLNCEGDVVIPSDVKGIADLAFSGNENITSVTFGDGLKDTGYASFESCTGLKNVVFSDSIEKIGFCSFLSSGIEEIVVPENVTELCEGAFADCGELKCITILNRDCEIFDDAATITNIAKTTVNTGVSTIEYNGVIRGYKGSTAQAYAEKYGYDFEVIEVVAGDLNGDGELGAADMVTLQKWLLGEDVSELSDWRAADLFEDGVIDVYDMIMMRKMIVG